MISSLIDIGISLAIFVIFSFAAFNFIRRYSKDQLKEAAWKAFFLWIVSTSPIFTSIVLSTPEIGRGENWRQFINELLRRFSLAEMFVYSAAFLAPMLYVIFDAVETYKGKSKNLTMRDLSQHMKGMDRVFLTSIIILILTLIAYAGAKTDNAVFPSTYLAIFLHQKGYVLYFVSLLIWFSVILWEKGPPPFSLEIAQRNEAESFSEKLAERRGEGR